METTLEPHLSTKTTAEIVEAMLKECTGRGITDSGDYYGRNWERNQEKDFSKEPTTYQWFRVIEGTDGAPGRLQICATLSLYHWMVKTLEYDPQMQEELLRFDEANEGMWWEVVVDKFADALYIRDAHEAKPLDWYTYNVPNRSDLSQDIVITEVFAHSQYAPSHAIIQVHGGMDARQGFTAPKCFRIKDGESFTNSMKLSGFAAGDQSWLLQGTSLEINDTNDCQEPLEHLPAYDLAALPGPLVESVPDLRDMRGALEGAEEIKSRLALTQFSEQQIEAARQVVDAQVKRITEELRNTCVVELAKRHEWFVICEGRNALLFSDDATEFADGDAIVAFSDFV